MKVSKIISIEITDYCTKVCEVSYGKKITNVLNACKFINPEGLVEDAVVVDVDRYVRLFLKKLSENNIRTKNAVFVLTSNKIISREVSIPFMKKNLIADYIEGEKNEYFPMNVADHVISYCIVGKDEEKNELKLILYAAPIELIREYKTLAAALGLKTVKYDYVGNAEYQYLKINNNNAPVKFYLEINEANCMITILEKGLFAQQRNLNFGTLTMLDTLAATGYYAETDNEKLFERLAEDNLLFESYSQMMEYMPEDEADEQLYNCKRELTEAVRPLILGVSRVLEYYYSRNKNVVIEEMVIGGCGSRVAGLKELMMSEFEGVSIIANDKLLGIKYSDKNSFIADNNMELMGCIGAAHPSEVDFNILSSEKEKQSAGFAVIILVLGLGAAVLLAGVPMINYYIQLNEQEKLDNTLASLAQYEKLAADRDAKTAQFEELKGFVDSTVTNNEGWNKLLAKLEALVPQAAVVSSVTADEEGVTLVVTTRTKEEVAKLLIQLEQIEEFQSVSINSVSESKDETSGIQYESFTVLCSYVKPEETAPPATEGAEDSSSQAAAE